jgi:thiol-disulfide isomerase/thioredoxin
VKALVNRTLAPLWVIALVLAGCRGDPTKAAPEERRVSAPAGRVEILAAPPGDSIAALVRGETERARAAGRELLVYVGASWCEPCQRFHDAATAGELDAAFPGLRLLEFDLDRDREGLDAAGYRSKMIPLFAVPRADGTSSGAQIEGSIKGAGAVGEIAPRLRALLDAGRAARR